MHFNASGKITVKHKLRCPKTFGPNGTVAQLLQHGERGQSTEGGRGEKIEKKKESEIERE